MDLSLGEDIDERILLQCDEYFQKEERVGIELSTPSLVQETSTHLSPKDLLGIYYKNFFPSNEIFKWLSYGNERQYLSNREFSFTLANDIYVRYLAFDNHSAFQARLLKDLPVKIDLGAVYNSRPSERKTIAGTNFRPVEHELVFDIDMSDYNDVRTCCQDKQVCRKCWKFISVAVKILNHSLEDDFGFKSILWVFSGRRGVHCWVADARARQMSISARKALVAYLDLLKTSLDSRRRFHLPIDIPHSVERALDVVKTNFVEIVLEDQDVLSSNVARTKFLSNIADEKLRKHVQEMWADPSLFFTATSRDYWKMFIDFVASSNLSANHSRAIDEIKMSLLYPRLDSNVSIQLNHLLKSPFCVHPATGKICVPFYARDVDTFDPYSVPTIHQMAAHQEIQLNSFSASLGIFSEFLNSLVSSRSVQLAKNREIIEQSLVF